MEQSILEYQVAEPNLARPAPAPLPCGIDSPGRGYSANTPFPHAPSGPRRYLLWGMGGTLLSVVGFVAMLLFEQYNNLVAELRTDLKHFYETQSELAKKDSLRRVHERLREFTKEIESSNIARAQMEHELRTSERAREDLTRELQRLRERLASVEGRQAATPGPR